MEQIINYVSANWVIWLFAVFTAVMGWGYRQIAKGLRDERQRNAAVAEGVRALLRDRIIQAYNHYYSDYGYCPIYALENIEEMYNQYHALGGNGKITKLVEQLRTLPTEMKER